MKSSKLLASLLLSASLSACTTFKISDWQAGITLPASQDCYIFNVVSGKETRLASDDKTCIDRKARSIWIDSESYKMLRADIQRNCQLAKCKQLTGAFDDLFLKLDSALSKIPTP